ncbi:hypothetical protein [Phenylobacterium sp.]|jgi:hypothetical protein|uniref:hypothetical protein n=1 Tax=Phenylobacterium sp. TaxID=1871053 RepID=UPI002F93FBF6
MFAAMAIALVTRLGDLSAYPELARYADLPRDVRVFIDRRMGCNHWLGEAAYDRDRAREIDRALRQLACVRLDLDESRLKRRHFRSPRVLKALDETRDHLW